MPLGKDPSWLFAYCCKPVLKSRTISPALVPSSPILPPIGGIESGQRPSIKHEFFNMA